MLRIARPSLRRPSLAQDAKLPAVVIAVSSFLITFDITAVIVAMPMIKADLNLDVGGFAWVMDAYSLSFTVLLMTAGILADRYGRRRALLLGTAVFAAASLFCGLAWTDAVLWVSRVAQGVGAAFVICGGLALISERYQEQTERIKAFALAGTISGAAMALGPTGGGMIAELFGWRWVFLINLPICALVAVGVLLVVDESSDSRQRRLDIGGLLTLTLALVLTIWTLLHGPRIAGVSLPLWSVVLACVAMFAVFIASQLLQSESMVDLSLFGSRQFIGMSVVPLALSLGYWAIIVYLPLYLQAARGVTLEQSSWMMLMATLPMVLLPVFGARLALLLKFRWFFTLGLLIVGLGCIVLAYSATAPSIAVVLIGMALCGSGAALVNAQISGAVVALVPRDRAGMASAVVTVLRQGGFAIGIACLGALLRIASDGQTDDVNRAGNYQTLFLFAGVSAIAGAGAVLLLLRGRE